MTSDTTSKSSRWQQLKEFVLREINIEPCLFLYCVYIGMYFPVSTTFLYYKTCAQMFIDDYGDQIHHFCRKGIQSNETISEQLQVETAASHLSGYIQICITIPGLLMSFVIGAASDQYGRKPPLLYAIAGTVLVTFMYAYAAWDIQSSNYILIGMSHNEDRFSY